MLETGADILAQYSMLKSDRAQYETTWNNIADDILGLRNFDMNQATKGQTRYEQMYDQTGLHWGMLLVSTMHGLVTNPGARWHQAEVPRGIRDLGENNDYLIHIDETLDMLYKSDRHGFPTAATEWWIDHVFFGTAGMYTADIPGVGPVDYARPLGELVIDEGHDGLVDTVYRTSRPTARQFIQKYGPDVHPETTAIAKTEPSREIEVVHLVHPRADLEIGSPATFDRRAIRSVHVVFSDKTIIREAGMHSDPWQVARWLKEAGEKYGRGPAHMALSDCQTASEMARIILESGQKALDPALMLPEDGVLTQLDTSPRGINIYRAGALDKDAIRQMPSGELSRSSNEALENTRSQIKNAFHGDLIQMFDSNTATQALGNEEKASRILLATVARAASEFAAKNLRRKFDVAKRAGMFDDPPDSLEGVPIAIRYLSPVMRAQKQLETRSILNTYAAAQTLQPFHPDIMDNYDGDFYAREIAENEGANLAGLIPIDVRDAIREQRAKDEEIQRQLDMMSQGSEAIGKALPALQNATQGLGAQAA